ncbi:MAG TPA: family 65 glycosyl hydrolase, partial [Cryomorphaceae bacterium]|nr:family 65 glycosyl hydrolase [Cryomorphaceae bacterium]
MFNKYTEVHPWKIIQCHWDAKNHPKSESLFSIGNGRMGQRANFEETYTGESLQGSYIAGVYYPDKTRVGWWKNGYPEYFAKVLNSCNWIGIQVKVDGEELDLNTSPEIASFYRELDMQSGLLKRS